MIERTWEIAGRSRTSVRSVRGAGGIVLVCAPGHETISLEPKEAAELSAALWAAATHALTSEAGADAGALV